ncbi:hypothetical protein SOCEGT47_064910 [Sorangium cellulosum]|uniref:DUF4331 domain-containing protein n=1 Tax=Sorangium cellulosum TaxID=56 RepID=A0A4P2Q9N5_SORCE|nr:DUF4331 domain-containing protein [Sorangium cellulosum]AUX25938.1 hypothetical protein SOCEGT47_064910 [Sorangium cellulosum]
MIHRPSRAGAALAVSVALSASGLAAASSHREAPAIARDPAADNTDLHAWVEGGNLVILASYIPHEEPAGGPNFHGFSDDVLYEVHIARGPSSLEDALTYQFRFSTTAYRASDPAGLPAPPSGGDELFSQLAGAEQTYTITKLEGGARTVILADAPVAPPNIGRRTNQLVYGISGGGYPAFATSSKFLKQMAGGEGRAWVGPRDDGFYADVGHGFDLAGMCPLLAAPSPSCTPRDSLAGHNVHTLALEIPLAKVNGGAAPTPGPSDQQTLGIWASASRRKVRILRANGQEDGLGPWVQVSRVGLPLINTWIIGLQDKDKYNRAHPRDDLANFGAYFLNPILVRDAEFAGLYRAGQPLAAFDPGALKENRTDLIDTFSLKPASLGGHDLETFGDVLRIDLGMPSAFPNGRALVPGADHEQTDITDALLTLLLTGATGATAGDGVAANDALFLPTFPYLATAWEGASQGHFTP